MFDDVNSKVFKINVQIPLKITIAQFITILKFAKVICLFLDGIISEMYKLVVKSIQIELTAACSYVSVLIEVSFELLVDACC